MSRFVLRPVLRACAQIGWYEPFLQILTRTISKHPIRKGAMGDGRTTLLALSPEGFRGDLEVLAGSGHFQILLAPTRWQTRLMFLFYREGLRPRDYLKPAPESEAMKCKQRLQAFYRELLPRLYRRLGIDCVISYHIRLPADVDWGMVSHSTGFPYVVLYREGLFASSPQLHKTMAVLFSRFGFWGSHLIVHNESCRQLCIDTGLVMPEKVSALGCLRMDNFIQRIHRRQQSEHLRKKVVLFPISLNENSIFNFSLMPFFNGVHIGLARLAAKYPEVDFVMKPKPKVYREWRKLLDQAFESEGIDPDLLPNLIMDANLDAQDLILKSDVVCGINSTTLLEAAIAGKPVVVPYFHELRKLPYKNCIKFIDGFQYLDVADDADSFVRLIEKRLMNPELSEADAVGRRELFKKYVSDPDGHALDKYVNVLNRLVSRHSQQHSLVSLNNVSAGTSFEIEDSIP